MTIIGIDVGLKGGIAELMDGKLGAVIPMRIVGGEIDLPAVRAWLGIPEEPSLVVVEDVTAILSPGRKAIAKLNRMFGDLRGTVTAMGYGFAHPTPMEWKKKVLAGQSWKRNKEQSLLYVLEKYPEFDERRTRSKEQDIGLADAVCLAEYGRMTNE